MNSPKATPNKILMVILMLLFLYNPITLLCITNDIVISVLIPILFTLLGAFIYYKPWSKKLFFVYFLFSFSLFILLNSELVFRNMFFRYTVNNLYENKGKYYFNKPNLSVVLQENEYQTIYLTNQFGYRIKDFNFKLENPNWLFIGDSYTQGAQVNFNELYTSRLSQIFPNKAILNAGISGFSLFEEYELIKNEFKYFKPEVCFVQMCVLNDFNLVEQRQQSFQSWFLEKSDFYRYLYFNMLEKNDDNNLLDGRWVLPFYPNEDENRDNNILYDISSPYKIKALNSVELHLREIASFLNKQKCRMIVILIPTKEQVYQNCFNEVVSKYRIDSTKVNIYSASSFLKKKSNEIGFELIDPIKDFKNDSAMLYFKKDEHLNALGHNKLSKIIATYITAN